MRFFDGGGGGGDEGGTGSGGESEASIALPSFSPTNVGARPFNPRSSENQVTEWKKV